MIASTKRRQPSRKSICEDALLFGNGGNGVAALEEGQDENQHPSVNNEEFSPEVIQPTKMIKVKIPTPSVPQLLSLGEDESTSKPPPPPFPKPKPTSSATIVFSATRVTTAEVDRHSVQTYQAKAQDNRTQFKRKLEEQLQNGPVVTPSKLQSFPEEVVFDEAGNATISIVIGNAPPPRPVTLAPPPLPIRKQPASPTVVAAASPTVVAAAIATTSSPTFTIRATNRPDSPKWVRVLGLPKNRIEVGIEQRRVSQLAKLRGAPKSVIKFMLESIVPWKDIQAQREQDSRQRDLLLI
ncbi:hypothetical protein BASA81_003693 [Batrachochytrium salamandrivorans]|nr:hypothetical protein BASA81_003693 [Batrachochytrium salamandrivorans]